MNMAMARPETLISVRGLTVGFGGQTVLENVDLDIYRGEIVAIVGGSGTGKTVLMRSILGLAQRQAGSVEAFGMPITNMDSAARLEKHCGVLFQHGALFSSLTVAQNIAVPMREYLDLPQSLMHALVCLKIKLVGLETADSAKYPAEISGGMTKRAALARALALDPNIVFLDEPTSGLDPISASAFDELIGDLRKTLGLTVVMVTHDLDTLREIVDRIVVIGDKRVLAEGDMASMQRFDHPWVRNYFTGKRAHAALGSASA